MHHPMHHTICRCSGTPPVAPLPQGSHYHVVQVLAPAPQGRLYQRVLGTQPSSQRGLRTQTGEPPAVVLNVTSGGSHRWCITSSWWITIPGYGATHQLPAKHSILVYLAVVAPAVPCQVPVHGTSHLPCLSTLYLAGRGTCC